MEEVPIYTSPTLRIVYDRLRGLYRASFVGVPADDDVAGCVAPLLAAVRQTPMTRWLVTLAHATPMPESVRALLMNDVFPSVTSIGIQRLAIVLPLTVGNRPSSVAFLQRLGEAFPFELTVFEAEAAALAWLLQAADADLARQ